MPKGVSVVPTTTDDLSFADSGDPPEPGVLAVLSTIAVETLNFAQWAFVEEQAARYGRGIARFPVLEFRLHWGRSMLYEVNGRPEEALESARAVSRTAVTPAVDLLGRCRRGAVLLRYGEQLAYRDLASSIRRAFEALDPGRPAWTPAGLPNRTRVAEQRSESAAARPRSHPEPPAARGANQSHRLGAQNAGSAEPGTGLAARRLSRSEHEPVGRELRGDARTADRRTKRQSVHRVLQEQSRSGGRQDPRA